MLALADLFDLSHTEHRAIFEGAANPWDVLPKIGPYLQSHLRPSLEGVEIEDGVAIDPDVFIGRGTRVEHGARIKGPAWIGAGCELRANCYIRGNVLVGDGCVVGNACELKNTLVFNGAQIPHFNYVGDSVLGHGAHLGAGVILSNFRLDHGEISVLTPEGPVLTGLRKFGALVGDHAEIGCNAVLNPGSIIGRNSVVYPGSQWRGILPPDSVAKLQQEIRIIQRRSGNAP